MIVIVDYGMGNLRSVQKGFERVGFTPVISRDPEVVAKAEKSCCLAWELFGTRLPS